MARHLFCIDRLETGCVRRAPRSVGSLDGQGRVTGNGRKRVGDARLRQRGKCSKDKQRLPTHRTRGFKGGPCHHPVHAKSFGSAQTPTIFAFLFVSSSEYVPFAVQGPSLQVWSRKPHTHSANGHQSIQACGKRVQAWPFSLNFIQVNLIYIKEPMRFIISLIV